MSNPATYDQRTRHDQPGPLPGQATLLDLTGEHIPADWVRPDQDLFVPNNPLHYEAHRLQILLNLLDRQAQSKPGQFNSTSYISVLEKYTAICKQIKEKGSAGEDDEKRLDERNMATGGHEGTTSPMGARDASSVGIGVSTDNPLAG